MTQDELWKHFLKKNPNLEAENISFSRNGIKKFFEATFQAGSDHGYVKGRAMSDAAKIAKPYHDPMDIFKEVLGKKKP